MATTNSYGNASMDLCIEFADASGYVPATHLDIGSSKGSSQEDQLVVSDPMSLQFMLNGSCFKRGPTWERLLGTIYQTRSLINLEGMSVPRLPCPCSTPGQRTAIGVFGQA
jgi:hypothetical protein